MAWAPMGIRGRGAVERSYPRPTRWGLNLAVLYPVGEDFTTLTPPNRGIPRRVPGTGAPLPPRPDSRRVMPPHHQSLIMAKAHAVVIDWRGGPRVIGGASRRLPAHVIGHAYDARL